MTTPRGIEFDKALPTFHDAVEIVFCEFYQFSHGFISPLTIIFVL